MRASAASTFSSATPRKRETRRRPSATSSSPAPRACASPSPTSPPSPASPAPRQITREDTQRFITIQTNVVGRDIGSFVADAQAAIDAEVELPPGYFTTWGGSFRLAQEANRRLALVVPITLLIICLLLYMSFGSLKNTLLILLNIPLALVGGVVALWIAGEHLSVPASVGFIALFGIALENGMVLLTLPQSTP